MKRSMKWSLLAGALLFSVGPTAFSATCDNSTDCELPLTNNSAATWTPSATGVSSIKCFNSVGPTGNKIGSWYYMAAASSDLGATVAHGGITTTGTGTQVIGSFTTNSSASSSSVVTGGAVQNLLGAATYYFYAQACPSAAALDSGHCSLWARIGSRGTTAYPATVFLSPTKPGDASVNTIVSRTSVPVSDQGFISQINVDIVDNINGANNETLSPISWVGNGAYNIDNSMYTHGFLPNNKYQYKGQLTYPYGVLVPTGGQQTVGTFWTTPVNPGPVTLITKTHCSAQIQVQNAANAVNPANPNYTPYQACLTGTGGSCQTSAIGGTGVFGDTKTYTYTNLNAGTNYTPSATAIVGNGADGTATGWNNSGTTSGALFTTDAWGGTFGTSAITTVSVSFDISNLTGAASISSWSILLNGISVSTGIGDPTGSHVLSGLTPNKDYTLQITLFEGSGCSSTLPVTPVSFTTLAATPQLPTSYNNITAVALRANWTDSLNQNGSHYGLQHCDDAGFTTNCNAVQDAGPKAADGTQTANVGSLSPESTYYFRVYTKKISAGGVDSSTLTFSAPAVTLNQAPSFTSLSCVVNSTQATCTATVTDNGGASHLKYDWSSGGVTFVPNNTVATSSRTLATFPGNGSYTITVNVTDHDGTGMLVSSQTTVNIGQTPTTISIAPSSATFNTGGAGQLFTATVRDQFGTVIAGAGVNWAPNNGAAGSASPSFGTTTTFTPGTTAGNFVLQATLGSASGSAALNIVAAGPVFTIHPFGVVNPDNKTITLTALADDNAIGHTPITYTWTLESGPTGVSFSPNGTVASSNTVATVTQAGTYVFRCTAVDNFGAGSETTLTPIIVQQILTGIRVSPNDVTVQSLGQAQFSAAGTDQFAQSMTLANVTWGVDGGGSINSAGVFSAIGIGQRFTITAVSNGITGTARVTVVNYDISGAKAFPVPYKSTQGNVIHFSGLGSDAHIRIYTTSGRKVIELTSNQDTLDWDVKNSDSEKLASGVYFYVIESPTSKKHGKLIIIQ